MKILILTLGSRGDVQPYVALGAGLIAAGHQVTLATVQSFREMIAERGIDFAPLQGEFLELIQTPEGKAALAGKGNPLALLRTVMPMLRQMLADAWSIAPGHDAVVFHPKALSGYSIAERLGIPGFLALPLPLYSPTAAFPSLLLPFANLGAPLNRASHRLMLKLATASTQGMVNRWRREALGLPPVRDELKLHGAPLSRLYAYSPQVLPTPPDWDGSSVATGYWFLDRPARWQPPKTLTAFLENGAPPVYVGFGSMPSRDAARMTDLVLTALERSGKRGVLATGWGGLANRQMPAHVYVLDAAPHDWLFPRMTAVVHHGGAGTTAAGLRAGVPTVIVPFFGDQPFWGRRISELGVGLMPAKQARISAEQLAAAITHATADPAVRARAAAIGERIRAEDGIGCAIDIITHR